MTESERVLFVHAHPDDETITTGGTIATLVDRGAVVIVLTCTRGELGEVIPADLRQLEGSKRLAAHRERELSAAMGILGVRDHRYLGSAGARWGEREPRRYTDSGMRWGVSGHAEATESFPADSLCAADADEVAADIAAVIAAVKPTAVVSYDVTGGYGHPDHIRAHEAARRAADVMEVPFFVIEAGGEIAIDVSAVIARKRAALVAYRSQVTVNGDEFALSSGPAMPIASVERFQRVREFEASPTTWGEQGLGVHLVTSLLAIVVGAALGAILTVEHQLSVTMAGVPVPVGIIVSLLIVAGLLVGARLVFDGRLIALFAGIGMLGVIGVLSLASAGGGVLVPGNAAGYLLVYGTIVIVLLAVVWPASGTFRRDKLGDTAKPKGTSSS
jgi:N-acetyl-1-D-myo-inositol-2-amino-2-deoxy-alpha-D-glucopyranoside deacetylase